MRSPRSLRLRNRLNAISPVISVPGPACTFAGSGPWLHAPSFGMAGSRCRLHRIITGVNAAAAKQLVLRPAVDDAAVFKGDDPVGARNRRHAMRDDDRGPPAPQAFDRLEERGLGHRVDRACRLV